MSEPMEEQPSGSGTNSGKRGRESGGVDPNPPKRSNVDSPNTDIIRIEVSKVTRRFSA
jgi:hypothetical protein